MAAALPSLPADGGTYVLSKDGKRWELKQQTLATTAPSEPSDALTDPETPAPEQG
jgi:hypothetical protein